MKRFLTPLFPTPLFPPVIPEGYVSGDKKPEDVLVIVKPKGPAGGR